MVETSHIVLLSIFGLSPSINTLFGRWVHHFGAARRSNPFPCLFVGGSLGWCVGILLLKHAPLKYLPPPLPFICCPDEYCVNSFYSQDGFVSVGLSVALCSGSQTQLITTSFNGECACACECVNMFNGIFRSSSMDDVPQNLRTDHWKLGSNSLVPGIII